MEYIEKSFVLNQEDDWTDDSDETTQGEPSPLEESDQANEDEGDDEFEEEM